MRFVKTSNSKYSPIILVGALKIFKVVKNCIKAKCAIRLALFTIFTLCFSNCKKFVEVPAPIASVNSANVYNNDATAIAALTGLYTKMSQVSFATGINSISVLCGLSSDELTLFGGVPSVSLNAYYKNDLTVSSGGFEFWNTLYSYIFTCNSAIEGLNNSTLLTSSVKRQLMGEAQFMRALCYYYLCNLYGNVPLVLGTDFTKNSTLAREPKEKVYQYIVTDLQDAQNLLSLNYLGSTLLNSTSERIRPTNWAAAALLARVYLFLGNWANAETQATSIINNTSYFNLTNLSGVFVKNSIEAIWQLQPVINGWNTEDSKLFTLPATGPNFSSNPIYLNKGLLNVFETGDARRKAWIDSVFVTGSYYYYASKYKANQNPVTTPPTPAKEYLSVLRLGEVYLIRAEARAQQGNLTGAIADVDKIRERAGLPLISNINPGISQTALLDEIGHQRRVELFSEWGHRWFDLKRTNKVDAVMTVISPQKGGSWSTNDALFPIPQSEINLDPNIIQNPGY